MNRADLPAASGGFAKRDWRICHAASPRTSELPRLLRLVAARHGCVLNVSDLARDAGIPQRTVHRYLEVLEAVFLVRRLPAWSANLTQREIRASKIYVTDSGLASHLRGMDPAALARPETALGADGPILEGLVYGEILRQCGWSMIRPQLMHYRDRNNTEVDLVLEDRQRRVAAIEVKAGVDIGPKDLRPLVSVRDQLGQRFVTGVVLNTGPEVLRLSDRIYSVPISALWGFHDPPSYNRLADQLEGEAIITNLGRDEASREELG